MAIQRIDLLIPGTPVAQGRPRATTFNLGGKATARVFDPKKSRGWKAYAEGIIRGQVDAVAGSTTSRPIFERGVPLRILVVATWPRPKSAPKRSLLHRRWRPKTPDAENVLKIIMDAITRAEVWHDDAQVVSATIEKWTGEAGAAGSLVVTISAITGD